METIKGNFDVPWQITKGILIGLIIGGVLIAPWSYGIFMFTANAYNNSWTCQFEEKDKPDG